jgi:diadenosine tetraphosphate (Ap4A) HIT family hydrolase
MCEYLENGIAGGWLYADNQWCVGGLNGLEIPGWVALSLRRHAVGIDSLLPGELATFGPVLAKVTAALRDVTSAEKVYFASFGENMPHFHVLLMSRSASIPPNHRGSAFQPNAAVYRDPDAALEAARRLREKLAT